MMLGSAWMWGRMSREPGMGLWGGQPELGERCQLLPAQGQRREPELAGGAFLAPCSRCSQCLFFLPLSFHDVS